MRSAPSEPVQHDPVWERFIDADLENANGVETKAEYAWTGFQDGLGLFILRTSSRNVPPMSLDGHGHLITLMAGVDVIGGSMTDGTLTPSDDSGLWSAPATEEEQVLVLLVQDLSAKGDVLQISSELATDLNDLDPAQNGTVQVVADTSRLTVTEDGEIQILQLDYEDPVELEGGAFRMMIDDAQPTGAEVAGMDEDDALIIRGNELTADDLIISNGVATLTFEDGRTMTIELPEQDGAFLFIPRGGDTIVRFVPAMPDLSNGQAISGDQINGVLNRDFLVGEQSMGFEITAKALGDADYNNVLGVYEVDANGNIVDIQIINGDTKANQTASVVLHDVEPGHELGFFVVQDGADWFAGLDQSDTFSFVDAGTNVTANAFEDDMLALAVNGVATDQIVFHSYNRAFNPDGLEHAISGVNDHGSELYVSFEDLLNAGDSDYEDVSFSVRMLEML